jgi:AraC family transcriptional activator of tynA and feaB
VISRSHAEVPQRWSASGATNASRLDSWSKILAATHLSFEVTATASTPPMFSGGVRSRPIDYLRLVDCAAAPFAGRRDPETIGAHGPCAGEDVIGFQFVGKGVEVVREGTRELTLTQGSVMLWDGHQPTQIEIVESFHKRTLLFPRDRVLGVCPRLAELQSLPALGELGPARLLVRYMNALALEQSRLDGEAAAAAADAALELLRAVVEPGLPSARAAERAALRTDIRRHVRAHMREPELGPAAIARAFSMSLRALHALFEDAEVSVAVLIRNERLARCAEDLRRVNGGSVTDIAFRWGFCDAAHFSRVFKRHYGATPSEVRQAAFSASALQV